MNLRCAVFSFLFSILHSHLIVFVHIGPELPEYLFTAIEQARLFNKKCPIYLIGNQNALQKVAFLIPLYLNITGRKILKGGLETVNGFSFSRFFGSFDPFFDFKIGGPYTFVDIVPPILNRKMAKIIPKIDENKSVNSLLSYSFGMEIKSIQLTIYTYTVKIYHHFFLKRY